MKREIVFRGKRIDTGEWIEGFYAAQSNHACFAHELKYTHFIYQDVFMDFGLGGLKKIEVVPETVGQYTGLTDKNGKKIFEGDILHFKAYRGGGFTCPIGTDIYYRVLFGHYNPDMNTLSEYVGFWALGKNYDEDDLYEYGNSINYLVDSHGAYVIGNIYDNPKLLRSEEE